MSCFYIMDGHGCTYQQFFAVSGNLKTSDGIPTNAVFGFAKLLEKILCKRPDYLAVCFDAPGHKMRHQMFADYKATRKPMPDELIQQMPWIKQLLAAHHIPVFELDRYEADDLMATLAMKCAGEDIEVCLLTQDKDLQQMVTDKIKIYDVKEDRLLGREEIIEHWQIAPDRLPNYFALVGDATDNIPGVKGIGPKTACKLLHTWPTLELLYEHLPEVTPERVRNLLAQGREQAFLSRRLFTLEIHIPMTFSLEVCRLRPADMSSLREIYTRLQFHSLLAKLVPVAGSGDDEGRLTASGAESLPPRPAGGKKQGSQQQEFSW